MAKNPRLIDLTGDRFGAWTVLRQDGNSRGGAALWLCRCKCGNEKRVLGQDLRTGKTNSCGCELAERARAGNVVHGGSKSRLHRIWKSMRTRCRNPATPGWKDYGGRGITICDTWSDFAVFREWALSNGYADDLSIERVDVDGGYAPENCTWATAKTQSENRRFTLKSPDGTLWLDVARSNGLGSAFASRVHTGWPLELAATLPLRSRLAHHT